MVDIIVSDNGFGKETHKKLFECKYITLEQIEKLCDNKYNFMHFCVPYNNKRYFYFLKQCIDMAGGVKCIVLHVPVWYEELVKKQKHLGVPIIYMPHSDSIGETWVWSMLGIMNDSLILNFEDVLKRANIKNKHCKLIGL